MLHFCGCTLASNINRYKLVLVKRKRERRGGKGGRESKRRDKQAESGKKGIRRKHSVSFFWAPSRQAEMENWKLTKLLATLPILSPFHDFASSPVLLPGKSHGRRSLVGCSPWGR